jgi:hypothetical protein
VTERRLSHPRPNTGSVLAVRHRRAGFADSNFIGHDGFGVVYCGVLPGDGTVVAVVLDMTRGLRYLHHGVKPGIFHRDIKVTNIPARRRHAGQPGATQP